MTADKGIVTNPFLDHPPDLQNANPTSHITQAHYTDPIQSPFLKPEASFGTPLPSQQANAMNSSPSARMPLVVNHTHKFAHNIDQNMEMVQTQVVPRALRWAEVSGATFEDNKTTLIHFARWAQLKKMP